MLFSIIIFIRNEYNSHRYASSYIPATTVIKTYNYLKINSIKYYTKKPTYSRLYRDPSGIRTQDPNIKSVVLYLLS